MTTEEEVTRPQPGTGCFVCHSRGHFCPAREYTDSGRPVCLFCYDGEKCPTTLAAERKRGAESQATAPKKETTSPAPKDGSKTKKEEINMPASKLTKKCAAEGCNNNAAASGSFCSAKHYYQIQKEREGNGSAKRPKVRKAKSEPGPAYSNVTEKPSYASINVSLSEPQCDALFARCTHQQKAVALSAVLHTLLTIAEGA